MISVIGLALMIAGTNILFWCFYIFFNLLQGNAMEDKQLAAWVYICWTVGLN